MLPKRLLPGGPVRGWLAAALLLAPGLALAQPTYWERHAAAESQQYLQNIQNQASSPNAPYAPITIDRQAIEDMVQALKNQNKWYDERDKQQRAAAAQASAAREAEEQAEEARRNAYLDARRGQYPALLPAEDREELLRLDYFYHATGQPAADRRAQAPALAAYAAFCRDSARASFDELRGRAGQVRGVFPAMASRCYQALVRRFPAQRGLAEGDELLGLPYFFGAAQPLLTPRYTAYPQSQAEAADRAGAATLLTRFEVLAYAHPALAGPAAGLCRPHLNPYLLLGRLWEARERPDSAAAYFLKVLRTPHDPINRPAAAESENLDTRRRADQRLRYVARWLAEHRAGALRRLSPDDWLQISETQALPVDLIAWVFRPEDFDPDDVDQPPYWQRFSALKKARNSKP